MTESTPQVIRIALKHVTYKQDYGYSQSTAKETVTDHGIALTADANGIVALTADECRRLARMLEAIPEPAQPNAQPYPFDPSAMQVGLRRGEERIC